MSTRRKTVRILAAILGACALAIVACLASCSPFARPSLAQSAVVVAPASGVSAPAGDDDVMVVLYSGDGGWSDLDKQLGTTFAARGIPVVGINTFKYFWRDRPPEEAARELDALINDYLDKWHKQRVWLVGFSFGADVLPTLVDRLDPATRARIAQLVLLSPNRYINFEIELEGYMTKPGPLKTLVKKVTDVVNPVENYPAVPPVAALANRFPVACYYGYDEKDESLCTEPGLPGWVRVHGQPGGHHFDEGYRALAAQMLAELPRGDGGAKPPSGQAAPQH